MSWFSRKPDPVADFKKKLQVLVELGDIEGVRQTLATTPNNFPPKTFSKALETAIKNDQRQIVSCLLDVPGIPVSAELLRQIVIAENKPMFRLIWDRIDFDAAAPPASDNAYEYARQYKAALRVLRLDLRATLLTESFNMLSRRVTEMAITLPSDEQKSLERNKDQIRRLGGTLL